MLTLRRLCGLLLAILLTATALSLPSGAHAVSPAPDGQAGRTVLAAKVSPLKDFARMPRRCVDPKLLIPQKPTRCNLNRFRKNRPTIVLWGDSHAWQMIPALRNAARDRKVNLVVFVMGSCPVMDPGLTRKQLRQGVGSGYDSCLVNNYRALRFITDLKQRKQRVHVLLGTYWHRYLRAIRTGTGTKIVRAMAAHWKDGGPRLFRTLGKLRVGVDVNGQMVVAPLKREECFTAEIYAFSCDIGRKRAVRAEKSTKNWLKRQMRSLAGKPRYVNSNRMCTKKKCFARPDGTYTFWDYQHISASMSRKLSYVLDRTVTRAGGKGAPHGGGPVLDGNEGGGDGGDGGDGGGGGGCPLLVLCKS